MMPHWVVLHMPQSWPQVPDKLRDQFLLNDEELAAEVDLLAEHHVRDLFHDEGYSSACVNGAVSRLVIDVERFVDNRREPAAKRGFGAFYTKTEDGRPLRRELTREEYIHLARRHEMHHRQLMASVALMVQQKGICLILECHTFPDQPLAFEDRTSDEPAPDICIGTNLLHTPEALTHAFIGAFEQEGWSVGVDQPFTGAIVPDAYYTRSDTVYAISVHVNRRICVDENGPVDSATHPIARRVRESCERAICRFVDEELPDDPDIYLTNLPMERDNFEVDECGTLRLADFEEPTLRKDVYGSELSGWSDSPSCLADALPSVWPLEQVVEIAWSHAVDDQNAVVVALRAEVEQEGGGAARGPDEASSAALAKALQELQDLSESDAVSWLLDLDDATFRESVVPQVECWLNESLEEEEWAYAPKHQTAQGRALEFFRDMEGGLRDLLNVAIIEGEHPGSDYYAAQLQCTVEEGNAVAVAAKIPVRFVEEGR